MCLFEDDILDERLRHDILLLHDTILDGLADDDTLRLGLEKHPAGGDGGSATVFELGDSDAGEAYLEDADALEVDLLPHLEIVLHGLTQFGEYGDDVTLLDTGLRLDELRKVVGAYKALVIDCLGVVLAIGCRLGVLVLGLDVLLTHRLNIKH